MLKLTSVIICSIFVEHKRIYFQKLFQCLFFQVHAIEGIGVQRCFVNILTKIFETFFKMPYFVFCKRKNIIQVGQI